MIAPGVTARLRGAAETLAAVAADCYTLATCWVCQTNLGCVANAAYVLCPACRSVSPLQVDDNYSVDGVGLGFTLEQLQMWQCEIVLRHRQQRERQAYLQRTGRG